MDKRYIILVVIFTVFILYFVKQNAFKESFKCPKIKNEKYNLSHLVQETQYVSGPLQDDEALFLYGLVKTLKPKTVVEFGFRFGFSAWNFLKSLDSDARLYSYDINNDNPQAPAHSDKRFKFYLKSMTEFNSNDIDNRLIDIALIDAGHVYDINIITYKLLLDKMSLNSVIIVHDTGVHFDESYLCACDSGTKYCGGQHQPDNRKFVNWIQENYPDWQMIHFHSFNIYRHGLTILQRKYKLGTESLDTNLCKHQ